MLGPSHLPLDANATSRSGFRQLGEHREQTPLAGRFADIGYSSQNLAAY